MATSHTRWAVVMSRNAGFVDQVSLQFRHVASEEHTLQPHQMGSGDVTHCRLCGPQVSEWHDLLHFNARRVTLKERALCSWHGVFWSYFISQCRLCGPQVSVWCDCLHFHVRRVTPEGHALCSWYGVF
eukprot:1143983-Pelagomonas_calceolata.AAC.3